MAGGLDGVGQEHGDRHRSDASRHRSYRTNVFINIIIINITAKLSVIHPMYTYIDHNGTLFDILARNHFRLAYCGYEYVRSFTYIFKVTCL